MPLQPAVDALVVPLPVPTGEAHLFRAARKEADEAAGNVDILRRRLHPTRAGCGLLKTGAAGTAWYCWVGEPKHLPPMKLTARAL